ncbi:uncharacterized protein ASCRUDRAFT_74455 [Ascoidea rubescens DSM 1968]|uniref:Acyl-coenzyme A diphosphatase SCS3 n=1 Tax=Ascoidea rubescens DSM 1968 TaxID=1344418 RepID=A0A1D2VN68_9ASCO|nr:hypothetical protein ASCRUDRAFT_74455 [Ascoidea rubescens DSM 1968]ODV63050.1 hypothetical protein ASCRUDRAFT_74455 [Ascoidea rubescens DSM 1968]
MANSDVYERHWFRLLQLNNFLRNHLRLSLFEFVVVASFPVVLVVGQLLSLSEPAAVEHSLFSSFFRNKKNFINLVFVKNGWFWNTFIYLFNLVLLMLLQSVHLAKLDATRKTNNKNAILWRIFTSSIKRYILTTLYWYFFTQWFFGKPIMDKIFILTGGKCHDINSLDSKFQKILGRYPSLREQLVFPQLDYKIIKNNNPADGLNIDTENLPLEGFTSSALCRRIGGSWKGGHDPSGHVFLLVHSSLFLIFELLPNLSIYLNDFIYQNSNNYYFASLIDYLKLNKNIDQKLKDNDSINNNNNNKTNQINNKDKSITNLLFQLSKNSLSLTFLLLSLWYFMLLITSIYFHSVYEKLFGLLFGYLSWFLIYIFPRFFNLNLYH